MVARSLITANRERGVNPTLALEVALDFARQRDINLSWTSVGGSLRTTSCEARLGSTAIVGRGKGIGAQSTASAVFETLEHLFHRVEDVVAKVSSQRFDLDSLDEELAQASPDFRLVLGNARVPLSCLRFQGLRGSWPDIAFPAILTNPAYKPSCQAELGLIERSRLYRYSTNSGTAAGLTHTEATLHGLLEVIERDAIGMELVRTVLSRNPDKVREFHVQTLPDEARELLEAVSAAARGAELRLWNITSDLNIPCVLCSLQAREPQPYRFFGSGASLNPNYAAERALLEALQGYHLQADMGVALQLAPQRNLDRMTLYQRSDLSAGYFGYRGGTRFVHFNEAFATHVTASPEETLQGQLDTVVDRLAQADIRSYVRSVHEGAVCVTQVLAPRLERIFLISEGLPVAPAARARAVRA